MFRSLNVLLLFLLLLTLPLRSIAAFTPTCEPTQHRDSASMAHHGSTDAKVANLHDDDSVSHGHHHESSADSHLATCGVLCGGAISPSIHSVALADIAPSSRVNAFLDHSYAGFIPGGLERPPRTTLC